ncbi:hypothetical protein PM030_02040 [Halorubrum ezzemoulense]|uniref:hypothetical protein n=1 Tax=Halorubrum ezzemoulense TaxID=337243 RepID=UPI00232B9174|nr:hypothetical protein [Halorubrum ezzemoulense]MDB2280648.1 hypothetical protein [Halorubrum ezzemoulense]
MTANATRRSRERSARSTGEDASRSTVPMAGTGDGPRPDPATFAPTARPADKRRSGRRTAPNHTADDDTTQ